jgi:hypothetical protein
MSRNKRPGHLAECVRAWRVGHIEREDFAMVTKEYPAAVVARAASVPVEVVEYLRAGIEHRAGHRAN